MAKVIIKDSGAVSEFLLEKEVVSIGRSEKDNDIIIGATEASRRHCEISRDGDVWWVEDLGSSNGTKVNGRRVTKFELQDGDEIQVGTSTIRFLATSEILTDMDSGEDQDEVELEISLEEEATLRFLNTDRADEKIALDVRTTIGRKSSNTISIEEKGVSGTHCEIVPDAGGWILRDLGSTNGTLVDGETVVEANLEPGTQIRLGVVHFVFGIGDNEGSVSIEATAAMDHDTLGEEVFAISAGNFKRRQKTAAALYFAFVAAVAGSVYFWVNQESSGAGERRNVSAVPGNLVTRNASFEIVEEDEDYLTTDSDSVEYGESIRYRRSGEQSLLVEPISATGTHSVFFADDIVNISLSDRLEIGGWFRTSGFQGVGGLSLDWMDEAGRLLSRSFLNASPGRSSFEEFRGVFKAPYGTKKARLGVTVQNAGGKLYVDDVWAVRVDSGSANGHELHAFEVELDKSGFLTVSRDAEEVTREMGLYWGDGDMDVQPVSSRFWASSADAGDKRSELAGEVIASDGLPGGPAAFSITTTERGFSWEGKISNKSPGFVAALVIDLDDPVVSVGEGGARRHDDDGAREGVSAVVIGTGHRAVQLSFQEPSVLRLVSHKGLRTLLFPVDSGEDESSFSIAVQLEFAAEMQEARTLSENAATAEVVEKKFGKAILLYQEVFNRFPFRQDLARRARERNDALLARGEGLVKAFVARQKDMQFFRTYETLHGDFVREATLAAGQYEGTDVADRIGATIRILDEGFAKARSERSLATARIHLVRGLDLMARDQVHPELAREFFESVVKLVPGTSEAGEASGQLEKIRKILGGN